MLLMGTGLVAGGHFLVLAAKVLPRKMVLASNAPDPFRGARARPPTRGPTGQSRLRLPFGRERRQGKHLRLGMAPPRRSAARSIHVAPFGWLPGQALGIQISRVRLHPGGVRVA